MIKVTVEFENGKIDQFKTDRYILIHNEDEGVRLTGMFNYDFAEIASATIDTFLEEDAKTVLGRIIDATLENNRITPYGLDISELVVALKNAINEGGNRRGYYH